MHTLFFHKMTKHCDFINICIIICISFTVVLCSDINIYEFSRRYDLSFPGKVLVGHVFEEFSTKRQVIHCAFECLKSSKCKSFNYELDNFICQLNDATHEEFNSSLVDEENGKRNEYHLREAFSIDQVSSNKPCVFNMRGSRKFCQRGSNTVFKINSYIFY